MAGKRFWTTPRQLQAKYKHAADFGVHGPYNAANAATFEEALRAHVVAPTTQTITGSYRGTPGIVFFVDPTTRLVVVVAPSGRFVTGWRLSRTQLAHLQANHKLGGGP
jgi:hypothetical protein